MLMPALKIRHALFAFLTLALPHSLPAQTNIVTTNTASLPAQTNVATTNTAPVYPPPPKGIVELRDVVIGKGGDTDLHADIAYPENATGPLPAVIYIHGGSWRGDTYHGSPIVHLAQSGYVGASIEYRLSKVATWPAQIQDCKLGVRWLRANADQYHVDPNRIGVYGSSAGGHLVACLGTMADVKEFEGNGGYPGVSSAVQAVVDLCGPTDLTDPAINKWLLSRENWLLGVPLEQNPALWKSASPLFYVKAGDPPMFIGHGEADPAVPIDHSIRFDAALTKAGVPHQFLIVKNGGHGFTPKPGTTIDPGSSEINKTVFAFLDKYLKAP